MNLGTLQDSLCAEACITCRAGTNSCRTLASQSAVFSFPGFVAKWVSVRVLTSCLGPDMIVDVVGATAYKPWLIWAIGVRMTFGQESTPRSAATLSHLDNFFV